MHSISLLQRHTNYEEPSLNIIDLAKDIDNQHSLFQENLLEKDLLARITNKLKATKRHKQSYWKLW